MKTTHLIKRLGYYDEGHEKKVKANKVGLILAASVLLKAATEYNNSDQNIISLDDHWIDENSDYYFDYLEKTEHAEVIEYYSEKIKESLFKVGCFAVIIFIIICLIIGAITLFKWWV